MNRINLDSMVYTFIGFGLVVTLWGCGGEQSASFSEIDQSYLDVAIMEESSLDASMGGEETATEEESSLDPLDEFDTEAIDENDIYSEDELANTDMPSSEEEGTDVEDEVKDSENNGGESTPDYPDDEKIAKVEIKRCIGHFGINEERLVQVNAGSNQRVELASSSVLLIRLNSSHLQLDLSLGENSEQKLRGVCLFVTGNQSTVNLNLNLELEGLVMYMRGNQSNAKIHVNQDAALEQMLFDLRGNQQVAEVTGTGYYDCSHVILKGNDSSLTCKP
jgi:hypothetical protein